jgi:hypothetical protein
VVGQRFRKIVAQVSADAVTVGDDLHQLPLRAQILEKEDELELKENHRVNRGSPDPSVAVLNYFPHEGKINRSL